MPQLTVPKRRFDAARFAVLVWGQDKRISGGMTDHWRSFGSKLLKARVRVSAAIAEEGRLAQEVAVGGSHFGELAENNVSNVRPGSRFDGRVGKLAWEALREKLAEAMTHAGRDGEGYTWLACHEVEHHLDEGLGENDAFLVWHVAGPAKCVVFPSLGLAVKMTVGDALVFDGMTPHGVRVPGKEGKAFPKSGRSCDVTEDPSKVTVFLGIDLPFHEALYERLGIMHRPIGQGAASKAEFTYEVNRRNGVTKVVPR